MLKVNMYPIDLFNLKDEEFDIDKVLKDINSYISSEQFIYSCKISISEMNEIICNLSKYGGVRYDDSKIYVLTINNHIVKNVNLEKAPMEMYITHSVYCKICKMYHAITEKLFSYSLLGEYNAEFHCIQKKYIK